MITRENYEAFYIDFLDGTLSQEMEKAFLEFLEANPDLQLEGDDLPVLSATDEGLSGLEKQLLKHAEEQPLIITAQNIEYALIAQLEGQLSADEEKNLQLWLSNHPEYIREQALYAKTRVVPAAVIYENKEDLYQSARIVPLWVSRTAIAASVALVVGISAFFSLDSVSVSGWKVPEAISKFHHQPNNDSTNGGGSGAQQPENFTPAEHLANLPKHGGTVDKKNNREQIIEEKNEKNTPNDKQAPQKQDHITNEKGSLLPLQPSIAEHVTEKSPIQETAGTNDENYYAWSAMQNPIEPITHGLSKQFKTDIDFRRQKREGEKESGFYLKIGKFELLHKKGAKH